MANIVQKTKGRLVEYEERHERILNTAMRLFSAQGYAATTTACIAKDAGVTEKTMFRHFASKEALFEACVLSITERIATLWQEAREKSRDDEMGYLKAVSNSYVDFVINDPDRAKFLVQLYSYRVIPELDDGFRKTVDEQLNEMERVIDSLQRQGRIRVNMHPRLLAGSFVGQYFTAVFMSEFLGPELFNVEASMKMTERFLGID
jgi:AcrR family transcriptional regulator